MRTPNKKIIAEALEFAARWGFLTRDLFFEFFCQMSQAQQYRYWVRLVDDGYFTQSKHQEHTLILSSRSRKLLGDQVRPSRSHFYIEHDSIVARFYLSLAQKGLLDDSWLEDELMRNPIEAYTVLGCQQVQRLPDLIFDLKRPGAVAIRCTLEIERVMKSRSRYAKIALAYLDMSKVGVSLFGCVNESTEKAIRFAFSSNEFIERKRIPGTFLYKTFDPSEFNSQLRFANTEMKFQNFLSVISEDSKGKQNEKPFSEYKDKKSEVA